MSMLAQVPVLPSESFVDVPGTISAVWAFMESPLGVLFALSIGISLLAVIMRLIASPLRVRKSDLIPRDGE